MLEDKIHLVPMAVDTGEAAAKSGYQILYTGKQHVSQYRTLEMSDH